MTHINIASLEVGQVIGTTEFLLTRDSLVCLLYTSDAADE